MDALRSQHILDENQKLADNIALDLIHQGGIFVRMKDVSIEDKQIVLDYIYRAYVTRAPNDFHAFLMALEWDRDACDRFYTPRKKILRDWVDSVTDMMVHDKYDFLLLSCPPGCGKSTFGIFFLMWQIGRQPEKCNLAIGYASSLAKSFFTRSNAIYHDLEYNYRDIFPKLTPIYKSAKDMEIDYANDPKAIKKPFVSLTCVSIEGQLNGRARAEGVLYCDDLVSGSEEAMSPTRLDKLWETFGANAGSRKKKGCKELHIGTRWSIHDPIGRVFEEGRDNERYKVISLPALNENDESNFDYEFGVGFTTEMFHLQRKRLNDVLWNALYMQKPIEAEGLLFPVDQLQRFSMKHINWEESPPDDIFAFCDVAFGGGDYLCFPILAQWGTDPPRVVDVVFSRENYKVTQPMVTSKIIQWGVQRAVFESNNGGDFYANDIKKQLATANYHCYITTQRAGSGMSKESRIQQHSPAILDFYFLTEDEYRNSDHPNNQYRDFMDNVVTYVPDGTGKHDDGPDALAGCASILKTNMRAKATIIKLKRKFL